MTREKLKQLLEEVVSAIDNAEDPYYPHMVEVAQRAKVQEILDGYEGVI